MRKTSIGEEDETEDNSEDEEKGVLRKIMILITMMKSMTT